MKAIVLTRKGSGVKAPVAVAHIETFNVDEDGVGSLMVLCSGTVRTFEESPVEIAKLLCIKGLVVGAEK